MFYNSKEKLKELITKIVKYKLYLLAHKVSGFDSYLVLKNLPQRKTVVSLIKNGAGIVSLEKFNGYVDPVQKIPQFFHFRYRLLHIKGS